MKDVRDHYFREAKRHGYRSRAAYKLMEIDDRRNVFTPGDRVLDIGCVPGSWIQVALERVGDRGIIVGIDLQPIKPRFSQTNVHFVEGDFTELDPDALTGLIASADQPARFSVVLSDMAPNTTGNPAADHFRSSHLCNAILDRLPVLLKPGGTLVMKCFEGETYPDLIARTRTLFDRCKGFKPKASRSESVEMFVIAHDFRPESLEANLPAEGESTVQLPPKRKPPRADWSR